MIWWNIMKHDFETVRQEFSMRNNMIFGCGGRVNVGRVIAETTSIMMGISIVILCQKWLCIVSSVVYTTNETEMIQSRKLNVVL